MTILARALMASHYFGRDSILVSTSDVFDAMSSRLHNAAIVSAISNINSSALTGGEFITYAHNQISGLPNLNDSERTYMGGYMSVLDSSYSFWNTHPHSAARSVENVAKADAYGYLDGFFGAIDAGYWYLAGLYAQYRSASCSAAAAR